MEQAVLSRVVTAQALREAVRPVFVFEKGPLPAERVTAGDLAVRCNQVAWALRRGGLARGDRVALMLHNHPELIYGLVAAARLGAAVVPVDPLLRGPKLAEALGLADCAGLLTADYTLADDDVAGMIRRSGVATWVVSTAEGRASGQDPSRDWPVLNEVLDGPERDDVGEHVVDLTSPWLVAPTSGAGGGPACVEVGHDRLLFYRRVPGFFGYRDDDVPYTGLPLVQTHALLATTLPALWGAVHHSVVSRWFEPARLWDVCIDHGCTTCSSEGRIAAALYREPSSPKDRAHRVRLVVSTGMPKEIWRPFEERFGVRVLEWYGTLEGGFAYNPVGVGPVGSFGKPPAGLEMAVLDGGGRPSSPGQIGELVVRAAGGEARLAGFRDPEAAPLKVRAGWLDTGDMVTRDEEGWFYFAHRKDEGGQRPQDEIVAERIGRRGRALPGPTGMRRNRRGTA
jgi:crotonobetaine/carnitine-CoA ligase